MYPDDNFRPVLKKYFAKEKLTPSEERYVKSWIRNYTPNSARGTLALSIIAFNVVLMIFLDHSFLHEYTAHIIAVTFVSSLSIIDLLLKRRALQVIKRLMKDYK